MSRAPDPLTESLSEPPADLLRSWQLARRVLQDLRSSLPDLLLFDLLFSILAFVLLSPMAAWFFAQLVASSGQAAVGNFDIAVFLLNPTRLILVLGATSLFLAISFLRWGGLLLIGYGAAANRRIRFFQALLTVLRRAGPVVVLSLVVLALLTLLLLPFLGAAGLAGADC